ncbi:MAG: helix-turn-helix domain-containing protein, partial [Clostridia bacterium]
CKDADVSKATGISKSTFSDWKSGRSKPKQEKLQKIADYFGVSVDYLMTGKNSSNIKVIDENNNIVVLDDEALELIDSLRSNPEMRMLFSVSKKATKEDIIKAVKIIEALKDENESD